MADGNIQIKKNLLLQSIVSMLRCCKPNPKEDASTTDVNRRRRGPLTPTDDLHCCCHMSSMCHMINAAPHCNDCDIIKSGRKCCCFALDVKNNINAKRPVSADPYLLDGCHFPYQSEKGQINITTKLDKNPKSCYYNKQAAKAIMAMGTTTLNNENTTTKMESKNQSFQLQLGPCFCPLFRACSFADFSASKLYEHVKRHRRVVTCFNYGVPFILKVGIAEKRVILQEESTDGVIFILNHTTPRVFSVDCIGPPSLNNVFTYKLTVRCNGMRFSGWSVSEVYTEWEKHTPNNPCLSLPVTNVDDDHCIYQFFSIKVCIHKRGSGDFTTTSSQ